MRTIAQHVPCGWMLLVVAALLVGCGRRPAEPAPETFLDVAAAPTPAPTPVVARPAERATALRDALQVELARFDTLPAPAAPQPSDSPAARAEFDVETAVAQNLCTVRGDGSSSLDRLSVTIRRGPRTPDALTVQIPAGTVFFASGGAQNLVTTRDATARLYAGEEETYLTIDAACLDKDKDVPADGDGFSIQPGRAIHAQDEVRRIIGAGDDADPMARQMAIWIVRSNPWSEWDLPYITTGYDLGVDEQAQRQRIDGARQILRVAGLNPRSYRVFQ